MKNRPTNRLAATLWLAVIICAALAGCHEPGPKTGPATATPLAPRTGNIVFKDVAQTAGLSSFTWSIPGPRPLNLLQTIGRGCAFLDYDNDGSLDILLVDAQPRLYHGDGHGQFTDVTAQIGLDRLNGQFLGCAVGDIDNDGFDDIYLSAYRGGILLHNAGGKHFDDITKQAGIAPQPWGTSAAFGDVNGDGRLDLYICNYVVFGPNVKQLCPQGGVMTSCGPREYAPEHGALYLNGGNGRFHDATKSALDAAHVSGKALGVAFADYDNSGLDSIYLANDQMPADLLHYERGHFKNAAFESGVAFTSANRSYSGMGADWGDYDNDGQMDLAATTFRQENKCVFHNDGGGLFTEMSSRLGLSSAIPYVAFGTKWLDADNDGYLDLMIANGHIADNIQAYEPAAAYKNPTLFYHNQNGAKFEDLSAAAGADLQKPIVGRGLAIGDYDNDGKVDVLIVDAEGAPLLLHNETKTAGHWLECRLIGVKSNRGGIGATITAETGGRKIVRRCGTDGSYLSASDRRVHLGLGDATEAALTIKWPGGVVGKYENVKADRVVTITEGASSAR